MRRLVEDVGDLVNPAALVPGAGKDLVERLPEAHGAVSHRDLRRDGKTAGLEINEQFPPALGTLTDPDLEADEFLLALGRRADDDQHASGIVFHPRLQIDAIGPHIDSTHPS